MRSTSSSWQMEQVKQLGCQQRSGPAREAPTQMSPASMVPGHCNSTNQHLIAHSQSTPRLEYVLGKSRTDRAFNICDCCDDTHVTALDRSLQGDRHLPDRAPAQRVPLPLRGKQPQLLLLVLPQVVAVPEKQIGKDLAAATWLIGPQRVALYKFPFLHFKSPCAEKTHSIVFQTQSP